MSNSVYDDAQALEAMAVEVTESRDRVKAVEDEIDEYGEKLTTILGTGTTAAFAGGEHIVRMRDQATELTAAIVRFRDFLGVASEQIQEAGK